MAHLAVHLHLAHEVHGIVPHLVILALNLVMNRYVTIVVDILASEIVVPVLRIHTSSEIALHILLGHMHVVASCGLSALELIGLWILLVVDLAHLKVSQELLVLVYMGAILLTVGHALLAHHDWWHRSSALVVLHPLHVAILIILVVPVCKVIHGVHLMLVRRA